MLQLFAKDKAYTISYQLQLVCSAEAAEIAYPKGTKEYQYLINTCGCCVLAKHFMARHHREYQHTE